MIQDGEARRFRVRAAFMLLGMSLAVALDPVPAHAQAPVAPAPPAPAVAEPPAPAWLGSRAGLSDEVLAPWTPLVSSGLRVSPWGRTYGFGPLPFPASIVALDSEVLAAPVTLEGVANGRRLAWTGRPARAIEVAPQRVRFAASAKARNAHLACEGTVTVEYDGMVRADFSIVPSGRVDVERLVLEVPVRREHARYLYCWPGRCGTVLNGGALPPGGYRGPFQPFVWLGDDRRGIAWFAESDRELTPGQDGAVLDVRDDGRAVVLRIVLIGGRRTLDRPVAYTFGFQATPVKPPGRTAWDYRPGASGDYDHEARPWLPPAGVSYPLDAMIDPARGTFECWVRPHFDPSPADRATLDTARNRNVVDLAFSDDAHIGLYWNREDRGPRLYFRHGRRHPVLIPTRPGWKTGEWHHIAFTWGEEVRLYLDGRLAGTSPFRGLVPGRRKDGTLVLGRPESGLDFDEVRVSDVARESFDLTTPPSIDRHTRLLDHLDEVPAAGAGAATRPERGPAGTLLGGVSGEGRFGRSLAIATQGEPRTWLEHLADTGARTLKLHEQWASTQAGVEARRPDALRRLADACHARGLALLLYFGYQLSNRTPGADRYAEASRVEPFTPLRMGQETVGTVCYASPWRDFLADGIARRLADTGADGVYLDGTSEPWGCTNTAHGCGYARPDGSVGKTYPIFAVRDLMKRIYTLVKRHDPDGQVNVHQSSCMVIPTLAFATSYLDGEQFARQTRGPFPLDVLPLDAFRAEFMGHNWGVPAEFLVAGQTFTPAEATAIALLHDVPVRGAESLIVPLWRAFDDFGRNADDCSWFPYWEVGDRARTGSPDVLVSLWVRPGRGVLAVVVNVGRAPVVADLAFDAPALGLAAPVRARDVLADRDVPLALRLAPLDFRVLHVKGDCSL